MLFFFAVLPPVLAGVVLSPVRLPPERTVAFLFLLALTTLVGVIDDAWGSRAVSGFGGHFGRLLRGELTTGALKALAIGAGSLILFLPGATPEEALLNAAVVALTVNAMNLLDLRPGRAGKVFLLAAAALTWAAWGKEELLFLWLVCGALLAFLPRDLAARAMMGDAGSNSLGAVLGLTVVWGCDVAVRAGVLGGLILLHLLTERYSLTEIIARNRVLNFLDRLGRRD
jgi:UDP-N-acetylmuramyl pentapeptide phosphotransferase/UDP-N-acetylglucosamine-1-phosphate transferase